MSMFDVIPYGEKWKERWDSFVLKSNNGTLFHLQRFLSYHTRPFPWNHLLFLKKGEIQAVLPAARMGSVLESPIGASYGSFVTSDLNFDSALELVDTFSQYCRDNGVERTLLTPPPFIYHTITSQNIDYALAYRGFGFDKHYISHAICLTKENFFKTFQATARRYVRKYLREREITISISDDLEAFYPILVENKRRHDVTPTHSLAELQTLKKLFPDRLVLFLVNRGKKPIAGSLVFVCNSQVALCFYNMLLYEFEHLNPIHAVMYEVVQWASREGLSWVDIGVSQDTKAVNQMTPAISLIRFKEKFGARGVLRSTYYKRFI